MKFKYKLVLAVVLLIALVSSLFTFVSCGQEIYTRLSRAKELVGEIEKIPSSYSAIEQSVSEQGQKRKANKLFASANPFTVSRNSGIKSAQPNIEVEENVDFSDLKYGEEINADYFIYHGDSVYSASNYYMRAIKIIKYYKDVALDTVKQLSVWVDGAKQTERKFSASIGGESGNYFIEKPAFRLYYDVNVDMVTLECKGKNWGGFELYIKAYCSYNSEGKIVISALMEFLSGYGNEHTPAYHIVPQADINNICYVEDEYIVVKSMDGTANWYGGTLSKEDFYKIYDNDLFLKLYQTYSLIDLKTGNILNDVRQHWQGEGWGTRAEYFTKLNDLIVIMSFYETNGIDCLPKYTDDAMMFTLYNKRAEELFVLDDEEKPLAAIDSKKAWISMNVTPSQRNTIASLFDIQQFADIDLLEISSLHSTIEFVENMIANNNVVAISAKEMFSIMDEKTIDRRNQAEDNEAFTLLDISVQGSALLNAETGEINMPNITAIIPQSILLTEGAEYSLVVALKGSKELIEVSSSQISYNGQDIEFQLSATIDSNQQIGMDDYLVVAYVAKISDDEIIRISNFYAVAAESIAQYKKNWQEIIEEETRYKTFDYTSEVVANQDGIMISQYKMISLSSK